jgi:mRNA-degrading endonuclease RelE of RelBE toxin-antitoxin system
MQTEMFPIDLRYSDEFQDNIKRLHKKYPHIRDDLEPLTNQLSRGATPGDRVKGTNHIVYKVRVKNSDANRGKSGGYRVLYYIVQHDIVLLLTIYSKSEQPDIKTDQILRIIKESDSILQPSEPDGD